ncbi:MAG: 4-hydroxy-tetrahydrodipicolinate synthase [Hamadaea sp.]|uniref:dihydrodipicolinate synthase family protein n=1 Tax=Hamadaea sp. TaxID=2024425 RepID=UPI0017B763D1|nr:dihydrodipicolinate synthase family protein [Hamadaea sp.]NUR73004.1 4-hydroxy-tetrahydrodipicolinate synthase [Hamadaea sp.]NUT18051.1 4-hydroxy-tetrahydrodipicolinate synthase [Hamadaea sp.]
MTLSGLFVPMITPFDHDAAVDLSGLQKLATQVIDDGATGLVALGTTAEPSALSASEKQQVLDTLSAVCRESGKEMIVGANSPDELRALADRPEAVAALTLVPPFVRPGEAGVVAYLERLAALSPVPLVIYHIPYRTGQALSAAALRDLAAIPTVVGFKYAAGGIDATTMEFMADPGVTVLGGDDQFISPLLALGAHGGILASAHLATRSFADLLADWRPALGHRLARLSAALFAEPSPTVIKAVLHARGRIVSPRVRLPLVPASSVACAAACAAEAAVTRA